MCFVQAIKARLHTWYTVHVHIVPVTVCATDLA